MNQLNTIQQHAPYIIETLTFTFFSYVFHMICSGFSRFLFTNLFFTGSYNKQTEAEKMDWDSRITSTVHAIISTGLAYWIFITYPETWSDMVNFYRPSLTLVACYSCGYLIADMIVVVQQGDKMMMIHHIMGILGLLSVASTGQFVIMNIFYLATEATTPFMNLRWFLVQIGYRESYLYMANGVWCTVLWFVIRVANQPIYYMKMYEQWDTVVSARTFLFWQAVLYPNITNVLNLIWFYKIVNGLMSVCFGSKKKTIAKPSSGDEKKKK